MDNKLNNLFLDNDDNFLTNLRKDPNKYITALKESDKNDVYELILYLQILQTFPYEVSFLINNPYWSDAKKVLDLGCGPGFQTSKLANFFLEKTFKGIDINNDFIKRASSTRETNNCKFVCDDVYNLNNLKFDYIITRNFLQHIKDLKSCFNNIKKMLNENGRLVVFEGEYSLDMYEPKIPYLEEIQNELLSKQKQKGTDKEIGMNLETCANDFGFRTEKVQRVIIPILTDETKLLFLKIKFVRFQVLYNLYGFEIDYPKLAHSLLDWMESNNSYAQEGLINLSIIN